MRILQIFLALITVSQASFAFSSPSKWNCDGQPKSPLSIDVTFQGTELLIEFGPDANETLLEQDLRGQKLTASNPSGSAHAGYLSYVGTILVSPLNQEYRQVEVHVKEDSLEKSETHMSFLISQPYIKAIGPSRFGSRTLDCRR